MKSKITFYLILHTIHVFFLGLVAVFAVASFANISSGSINPFNGVAVGTILFLVVLWIVNYMYQIKRKNGKVLVIGVVICLFVTIITLYIYPYLFDIFYN